MDETYGRRFGRRLRFYRDEAGLDTDRLAELTGISPHTIDRHMRGANLPDIVTAAKYADALGIDPGVLLPRLDSNQQPTGSRIAA